MLSVIKRCGLQSGQLIPHYKKHAFLMDATVILHCLSEMSKTFPEEDALKPLYCTFKHWCLLSTCALSTLPESIINTLWLREYGGISWWIPHVTSSEHKRALIYICRWHNHFLKQVFRGASQPMTELPLQSRVCFSCMFHARDIMYCRTSCTAAHNKLNSGKNLNRTCLSHRGDHAAKCQVGIGRKEERDKTEETQKIYSINVLVGLQVSHVIWYSGIYTMMIR